MKYRLWGADEYHVTTPTRDREVNVHYSTPQGLARAITIPSIHGHFDDTGTRKGREACIAIVQLPRGTSTMCLTFAPALEVTTLPAVKI